MQANISTQNTVTKLYSCLLQYQLKDAFLCTPCTSVSYFFPTLFLIFFPYIFPIYVAQPRKLQKGEGGGMKIMNSNSCKGKRFYSTQNIPHGSGAHPLSYAMGLEAYFSGSWAAELKF